MLKQRFAYVLRKQPLFFFQFVMCFAVAFGKTSVFCCQNGSFFESVAGPVWSQRSAVCPPLGEESFSWEMWFVAIFGGSLLLWCLLCFVASVVLYLLDE